ncbi:hypothetical protein Tco_0844085, partial [Tanacetum coccineum]
TLSKTLQARLVVEDPQTAKEAWDLIAEIFNDNKRTRSIALKAKLRSLKLGDLSIELLMHIFGLPDKYDSVSGIIVHRDTFSNLKTVRSMITTEEMRFKSRAQATSIDLTYSSPMVLLSTIPSRIAPSMPNLTSPNENVNLMVMHTGLTGYARPVSHYTGPPGFSSPMYGSTQIGNQQAHALSSQLGSFKHLDPSLQTDPSQFNCQPNKQSLSGQNSTSVGQSGLNPAGHKTLLSNAFSAMTL